MASLTSAFSIGVILFRAELIGQSGGINHCSLGFFFRVLCLSKSIIDFGLESMDQAFYVSLIVHGTGVNDTHFVDGIAGISQFRVKLSLGSFGRIQKSSGFFYLSTECIGLSFGNSDLFHNLLSRTCFIFVALDGISKGTLVAFDSLCPSLLALLAWSRAISNSLMSDS